MIDANAEGLPSQEIEKSMLNKITYVMPDNEEGRVFTDHLFRLLHLESQQGLANLDRRSPPAYSPVTYWSLSSDVNQPNVVFTGSSVSSLTAGALHVGSSQQNVSGESNNKSSFDLVTHVDDMGPYIEGVMGKSHYYWLTMEEVSRRLKDAGVEIDHTGINLPTTQIQQDQWDNLISQLGKVAVVYDYPEEPWPFIVPATKTEFAGEVTDATSWRGPKFELVHERYSPVPVVQFSLDTNLSKEEVHRLFPGEYAETFPNLADFFRSVYIKSPWSGLIIRADINYKSDSQEDGLLKYLMTEGKRI